MSDFEDTLFTRIATLLRSEYTGITVYGEFVKAPASFPAVVFYEQGNGSYIRSQDSASTNNHNDIMYEVNVFSNATSGKKRECKTILNTIDTEMLALGFTRVTRSIIENLYDATIFRMVARYSAVIDAEGTIYRR